ncbi:MAG: response regulator, partial [Algoriphagus sp.]
VELHESKIQVTSSPGVGTIFDFTLNFICVEKTSYAQSKELEPNTKSLQQAAILVAEDNLVNQILIKKFLNKWQVGNLVIASDGQEAIIRFEEGQFDLILLDIQMPEMDGFEVARRIRQHEDSSKNKTPILILSATSFHEIKDEMMESGINDFIEKPFSPDGLYTKLTEYLNWKEED